MSDYDDLPFAPLPPKSPKPPKAPRPVRVKADTSPAEKRARKPRAPKVTPTPETSPATPPAPKVEPIRTGVRLCSDCMIVAINGDTTGISSDERRAEVIAGLERLGTVGHLTPDFDTETGRGFVDFARGPCGCCRSPLAGAFHDFAIFARTPGPTPGETARRGLQPSGPQFSGRFYVHVVGISGERWTSPESFNAASIRDVRQCILAGYLNGTHHWATAEDGGAFIMGIDPKGLPMSAESHAAVISPPPPPELARGIPPGDPVSLLPTCKVCGHICGTPTGGHCSKCGGDPMVPGDTSCVDCDVPPPGPPEPPGPPPAPRSWDDAADGIPFVAAPEATPPAIEPSEETTTHASANDPAAIPEIVAALEKRAWNVHRSVIFPSNTDRYFRERWGPEIAYLLEARAEYEATGDHAHNGSPKPGDCRACKVDRKLAAGEYLNIREVEEDSGELYDLTSAAKSRAFDLRATQDLKALAQAYAPPAPRLEKCPPFVGGVPSGAKITLRDLWDFFGAQAAEWKRQGDDAQADRVLAWRDRVFAGPGEVTP